MVVFLFELSGAPAGRVTLDEGARRYVSEHFFRRGAVGREEAVLPEGRPGASFALLRLPSRGCRPVVDEVSLAPGELCVDEVSDGRAKGRLLGQRFEARYAKGALEELKLGPARFSRWVGAVAPGPSPFDQGFPLDGDGALHLEPAVAGARVVDVAGGDGGPGGDCLERAQAYVASHPGSAVELGLVAHDGRAWPHAWVRARGGERVDPSAAVPFEAYLALEHAGERYVELLAGQRRVVRR